MLGVYGPKEITKRSWIERNRRSREAHLKNTLDRSKSSGDRIRGGEVRESLENPPRSGGDTPNHLGFTLGHWWKKGRRSLNEGSRAGQGGYIPRGLDLSGGTLDRTCLVWVRLVR
jgi:hypothetical protein